MRMTPPPPAARRALAIDVALAVATFAPALVTIATRRFEPDAARGRRRGAHPHGATHAVILADETGLVRPGSA